MAQNVLSAAVNEGANVMRTSAFHHVVLGLVTITAGCGATGSNPDDEPGLAEDVGLEHLGLRKGTPGARIGDGNYCDNPAARCAAGEGDCDSSSSCEPGLVCSSGKLKQFGFPAGDACVPAHCANKRRDGDETQIDCGGSCGTVCAAPVCKPNGSSDRCTSDCLCGEGEGDCDSSTECATGLICAGKLSQFGFATGNACVPPHCANKLRDADETQIDCGGSCGSVCPAPACKPNGSSDRCNSDCLCGNGEGDCDSNDQCATGLLCVGKLSQFGFAAGNACVPAHCANHLRDGDETQIDCGGSCGSVCPAPVCKPNGSSDRCNSDCPCGNGEGDCDSNDQCTTGLVCGGKLSQFGFPAGGNACVPPHCTNNIWDADETQVDCGGDCGSVGCERPCLADGTYVIPITGKFRDFEPLPAPSPSCPDTYTPYTSSVTVTVSNGSVYVSGNNASAYLDGGLSGTYPVTQSSNESYTAEISTFYGPVWQEFQCGLAEMMGFFGIMDSSEGSARFSFNCKTGIASFDSDCLADISVDGCYPNYEDISHGSVHVSGSSGGTGGGGTGGGGTGGGGTGGGGTGGGGSGGTGGGGSGGTGGGGTGECPSGNLPAVPSGFCAMPLGTTATGPYYDGGLAPLAVDGDLSTAWNGGAYGATLTVTLPAPTSVASLLLYPNYWFVPSPGVIDYTITIRDDGGVEQTVQAGYSSTDPTSRVEVPLSPPRLVTRITIHGYSSETWIGMFEVLLKSGQ